VTSFTLNQFGSAMWAGTARTKTVAVFFRIKLQHASDIDTAFGYRATKGVLSSRARNVAVRFSGSIHYVDIEYSCHIKVNKKMLKISKSLVIKTLKQILLLDLLQVQNFCSYTSFLWQNQSRDTHPQSREQ